MTRKELETWWSYWTPEHHEFDERDTNGGRYWPLARALAEDYDSRPDTYEHIAEVRGLLMNVAVMLLRAAHAHDASKLVAPEVEVFDEFTPKLRDTTYGSPEYKEFLEGMGVGLRHHYDANRHHPEHFPEGIAAMDLLDVLEMLCDWIAATKRHADGDIQRSIEQNQERFGYGDEFKRLLANTVDRLVPTAQDSEAGST